MKKNPGGTRLSGFLKTGRRNAVRTRSRAMSGGDERFDGLGEIHGGADCEGAAISAQVERWANDTGRRELARARCLRATVVVDVCIAPGPLPLLGTHMAERLRLRRSRGRPRRKSIPDLPRPFDLIGMEIDRVIATTLNLQGPDLLSGSRSRASHSSAIANAAPARFPRPLATIATTVSTARSAPAREHHEGFVCHLAQIHAGLPRQS